LQAFKPGAPVLQNGGKAAAMQITLPDDFEFGSLHHFDEEEFNSMCVSLLPSWLCLFAEKAYDFPVLVVA